MTARIQIRTIALALLTACAGLTLFTGSARAEFDSPFVVTDIGDSGNPQVEVDPSGAMHFAWWRPGAGLETRKRSPDGTLGTKHVIGPSGGEHDLAIDGAGNVYFTWRLATPSVYARRMTADGTVPPAIPLAPGSASYEPRVAAGPTGAVFAWTRETVVGRVVESLRVALDGSLGPVKTISAPGAVIDPGVAVDDAGNAVFVWTRGPSGNAVTETRRWNADGQLDPIKEVSGAGSYTSAPQVAFDSAGAALYAVARSDGLKLRRMAPDGTLSAVQDLRLRLTDVAYRPRIAPSADGGAQIAWQAVSAEDGYVIETRQRFPNGLLSEVRILGSYEPGLTPSPDVAFDDQGNSHHVWLTAKDGKSVVVGRSRATSGALGPLVQLSAENEQAVHPALSRGGVGRPVATWIRDVDASTALVQGALSTAPVITYGGGDSGAGGTTQPPLDTLRPTLSGLSMTPGRLRFRRPGRVNYVLSENARLVLQIARRGAGRRAGGRCVKKTRRNRSLKPCDLFLNARLITSGQAERNGLAFSGRIRGRYLRPGRYVLAGTAIDWAGNRSAPVRATFRIRQPSS